MKNLEDMSFRQLIDYGIKNDLFWKDKEFIRLSLKKFSLLSIYVFIFLIVLIINEKTLHLNSLLIVVPFCAWIWFKV